ncbi:MAG: hypothetical protein JSU77_01510 [Fidelibacterota bacterium]|nr:MAG: hypothetical protein JSU77_01510 [Candidatus Neomarinimicrobiota bacterium]
MSRHTAHLLSIVFNPLFNSIYVFLLLVGADRDLALERKLAIFCIAFLFSSVVPMAHVAWLKWRGIIESLDVEQRQRRLLPLIVGILSYAAGYLILFWMQAPAVVSGLMFCYAANTLLVAIITRWWKVSIHATGIAGPIVALIFRFGWLAVPLYALVPIIAQARVVLGKHTVWQVVVGACIGTFLTAFQLYYLFHL